MFTAEKVRREKSHDSRNTMPILSLRNDYCFKATITQYGVLKLLLSNVQEIESITNKQMPPSKPLFLVGEAFSISYTLLSNTFNTSCCAMVALK